MAETVPTADAAGESRVSMAGSSGADPIPGAPLTIADGVRNFARAQPGTVAVIDGERSLTYAGLEDRSNRVAQLLRSALPEPGARVGVLLGNRSEYLEVAAGIAKAGLVMVPLNPRMTGAEAAYVIEHSGAGALILDEQLRAVVQGCTDAMSLVLALTADDDSEYERELRAAPATDPEVRVEERDPFCIAYTSGTTGRPKGVVISHRSRALTFVMSALEWGLGAGRRSIAVAPLYHGAGFAFGYAPVVTGGTVSMLRGWDPRAFLETIQRDRIQSAFLVPTHAQMLRALGPEQLAEFDTSSLDTLFFNAAALPRTLKAWVMETWPDVAVHELYGSTESGIITNLRPPDAARKAGSVGHPWFLTEVRVVDAAGDPVAPGEPGELFSRSPYLMNGYLDDPEATAACTTDDGFVTCGDVAVVDEEGFISIVDRLKDVIITGGVNVYPREVEEAMLTHPGVLDAAVVGVPDDTWGERVVAFAVPAAGHQVTLPDLDTHLREQLAGFKLPRALHQLDRLPRNAGGKVLKTELRERARSGDAHPTDA